ncbi:DNA methyltransferase [Marinospirillum minutulum]|uniref:DNA methyltransferase n=1 Tax=Marinospirillum minutulum TaxID=64974 RepID=UPI00040547D0|nr:DNA methyltransferase [Marinospirillum minutulum]
MPTTQEVRAKQQREKFAALLKDMFQLDQPELDFGLYRIMHARKDDINRFIEQDLPSIAQDAFADFAGQDKAQLEQELEDIINGLRAARRSEEQIKQDEEVIKLKNQLEGGFDTAREEGEVYNALVTFFSRYYDEGDFISRRMYKEGTYAIPYQGEEVVMHWANKDQYYIKSSETLRDYSFRLNPAAQQGEDPLRVHFKLVDAEAGAKDNNKEADDNKRVFVLDAEQPFELLDGEEKTFKELHCRFKFRPATLNDWTEEVKNSATAAAKKNPPTQAHLVSIAQELLLGENSQLPANWLTLLTKPYLKTDGNFADYSTLVGQLNNYTKKNTFDYFIHKDLGGFLTRELDFYIKNELMQWDDIAALKNNPARLAPLLSKLDVIRNLGEKIITFLAQLENFQKKLWLKKKFVTETNYCITLDRVPEVLYSAIIENTAQLAEWIKLFALDEVEGDLTNPTFSKPLTVEFLKANQNLVLDTQFFDEEFKAHLIASIEEFDKQCDGLIVHSENFQALNLLQEGYKEKVKCIYIDPPYNTGSDGFVYKDSYQSSSWISFMENRISKSTNFISNDGVNFTSIDENELGNLSKLSNDIFGNGNFINQIALKTKVAGVSGSHHGKSLKNSVEYLLLHSKNQSDFKISGSVYDKTELMDFIDDMESEGKNWKYVQVMINEGSKEVSRKFKDGYGDEIILYKHTGYKFESINSIAKKEFDGNLKEAYYSYINKIFDTTNAQSSVRQRVIDNSVDIETDLISIMYIPKSGRNQGKITNLYYKGPSRRLFTWLKDTVEIDSEIFEKINAGNLWMDIQYNNVAKEGDVSFPNEKNHSV